MVHKIIIKTYVITQVTDLRKYIVFTIYLSNVFVNG